MADDVVQDAPIEISDGTVEVPDGPGLGVDIDEDELQRLSEAYDDPDVLGYSSVGSMASEYADAMAEERDETWLPNKPIW
jgi:glucarate dehydratase